MRHIFQAFDLGGANRLETCCSFDRIVRWINAGHVSNASCLKTYFQSLRHIMHGSAPTAGLKAVGVSGGIVPEGVFGELAGSPAETVPVGVSGETDPAGTSGETVTVGISGETVPAGISGRTDPADSPGKMCFRHSSSDMSAF
jgi:hypothetical protein